MIMKFKDYNPLVTGQEVSVKIKLNSQLLKLLPGMQKNIKLASQVTFKIGGEAEYFFVAKTKEDLIKAIKVAKRYQLPFFILGGGSNLLISDKGFKGIVIKIQMSNVKRQNTKIYTEAGLPLSLLLTRALENNLTGLEWAVGIPGTVGGAIRGNAGAFGCSMAGIVKSAEVLEVQNLKSQNYNSKLKSKILKDKDCKFGYKDSIFKHQQDLIILSAHLQFKKDNQKEIKKKIKEYLDKRKKTQPNFPSAGSVFKNPPGFWAGELIEKCGLKGKKLGKAQISKKHANFIINLGGAKAEDVKKLINLAKLKVKDKFGIKLEEEIQYLGF